MATIPVTSDADMQKAVKTLTRALWQHTLTK
jgi:hypothetical protein